MVPALAICLDEKCCFILDKLLTPYIHALTCRWQQWAPSWTGVLASRHMSSETTTCCLGCAHTTWGGASTNCGRPSEPPRQPLGISRSSPWEMISTRLVPFKNSSINGSDGDRLDGWNHTGKLWNNACQCPLQSRWSDVTHSSGFTSYIQRWSF